VDVSGWLVDDGPPLACPPLATPSDPPVDIWAPSCGDGAWITAVEVQPVISLGNGVQITVPTNGVRVQPSAYQLFAHDPATEADGMGNVPRLGTYTLRLIQDPRFPVDGSLGWEIVQRVEP
jgi:hypothetical protein